MRNTFILTNAHIGKDAEINDINGQKQAKFTVAERENYKDRNGNWQERTQWHNVVMWGAVAERAAGKALKGVPVNIVGTYRVEPYEKDGVKRTAYYILVDRIEYLYPKPQGIESVGIQQQPVQTSMQQTQNDSLNFPELEGDKLPF